MHELRAIKKSKITFLEGYLWDEGNPKKALERAIINSNKVAMSLSDKFCVDRHKKSFLVEEGFYKDGKSIEGRIEC